MKNWILPVAVALVLPAAFGATNMACKGGDDGGPVEQNCADGLDDDGDGDIDCDDADCLSTLACGSSDTDATGDTDDTGDTGTPDIPDFGDASDGAIYGEDDDEWLGFSIDGGADINGDGTNDVIVGAPKVDCDDSNGNKMENSGAAYVFFGPVTGQKNASDADITICGGRPDAALGSWVGIANGLTGTGSSDIVVSAPTDKSGRIFIMSGLAASADPYYGDPSGEDSPVTVDIVGEDNTFHFGDEFQIGALGTGNGAPSVMVGSYAWSDSGAGSGGSNVGRTYVFEGPLTPGEQYRGSRADTYFTGKQAGEDSGRSIGYGDFNGDGKVDIAIGALGTNSDGAPKGGAIYIKWGNFTGDRYGLDDVDVVLRASDKDEGVGQAVAAAGDYNDDGITDMVVGAHTASAERGAAYVWFGSSEGWSDATTADVDVRFRGGDAFDRAGHGVDGLRDITGDGVDDLVVGALGVSGQGSSRRGATYVLAGNAVTGAVDIDRAAWATFYGDIGEEAAGHRVRAPGDITGDGKPDLIIGAYRQALNGDAAGAAYILAGPIAEQPR